VQFETPAGNAKRRWQRVRPRAGERGCARGTEERNREREGAARGDLPSARASNRAAIGVLDATEREREREERERERERREGMT
jgi:hypothetical protein